MIEKMHIKNWVSTTYKCCCQVKLWE